MAAQPVQVGRCIGAQAGYVPSRVLHSARRAIVQLRESSVHVVRPRAARSPSLRETGGSGCELPMTIRKVPSSRRRLIGGNRSGCGLLREDGACHDEHRKYERQRMKKAPRQGRLEKRHENCPLRRILQKWIPLLRRKCPPLLSRSIFMASGCWTRTIRQKIRASRSTDRETGLA